MGGSRLLVLVRCILLLLLAGILSISLGRAVLSDLNDGGMPDTIADDADPGLRVLLHDPEEDDDAHAVVTVQVLQESFLICPDAPQELFRKVPAGSVLRFLPDLRSGVIISSRGWEEDLDWQVAHLRLFPKAHGYAGPDPPPGDSREAKQARAAAVAFRRDLRAADGGPTFAFAGNRYSGVLELHRTGPKSLRLLNCLPIEDWLPGVLEAEMGASWPLEALKAQAIASRSFAFARVLERHREPFDLRDRGDQAYRGVGGGGIAIETAVAETEGRIMAWQGLPFTPFHHPSSGGMLADVDAVFPGAATVDDKIALHDIMIAGEDAYCREGAEALGKLDTHWKSTVEIPTSRLRNLKQRDPEVGWPRRIETARGPSGRIVEVEITTYRDDPIAMSGEEFRDLVGRRELRSTLWEDGDPRIPSEEDLVFVITAYGWGHGVGMSQVSAYAMARIHGMGHRTILGYFYHGHSVDDRW